jgi:hypothetical protein
MNFPLLEKAAMSLAATLRPAERKLPLLAKQLKSEIPNIPKLTGPEQSVKPGTPEHSALQQLYSKLQEARAKPGRMAVEQSKRMSIAA